MDANPRANRDATRRGFAHRENVLLRALGIIALIGVAVITVICLLVQFLRSDLDWITTSMSIYVKGPYGAFVQASFYAPAPGIAALGIGWYLLLERRIRNLIPMALFVTAGIALCVTASYVADPTIHPVTMHGRIHQWAAFATFVCATTAMLLQAWHLHKDSQWRTRFRTALPLAAITIVYFWIYALVKPIPRGLGEKVVIGLVLLWLWRAAWWLVRDRSA